MHRKQTAAPGGKLGQRVTDRANGQKSLASEEASYSSFPDFR
jgi:hypothetical protein